ncbi:MAG TPA: hypothetical protein PLV45_16595 [bacterium]|nr:hypothetical protein [bacterium]
MNGFDRLSRVAGWTGLVILSVLLSAATGPAGSGKSRFYVCTNSLSPAAFDRSDLIPPCCDGSVESKPMTRSNLMNALNDISQALRAVSFGRGGELTGPETLTGKADCYARSISFISGAMGAIPPEKSRDKPEEYASLLNDLMSRSQVVQKYIQMNDKAKAVIAFQEYQNTCGQCHSVFR